jgi:hypothetical protein
MQLIAEKCKKTSFLKGPFMAKTSSSTHGSVVETKQGLSSFAILEQALRITHVIIKIAIDLFVPKGGHLYDPGVIF